MNNQPFEQFIGFQEEIRIRRVYVDICKDLRHGAVLGYIVGKVTTQDGIFRGGECWIIKNQQDWWREVGLTKSQVEHIIDVLLDADLIKVKKIYEDNAPRTCITINRQQLEQAVVGVLSNG